MTAADESGATPSWASLRASASQLGSCRVVYVDDDPDYAHLFKVSLERLGHHVAIFSNPLDSLAAIESRHAEFDAFITDFNLPGHDGVALALEARRRRPDLPRAVLTNHLQDVAELAREVEVLTMTKPAAPREFIDMLAHVLASG